MLGLLAQEQLHGRLAIEPRVALATSEVLTDETVRRIEDAWGAPPLNVYAATEAPGSRGVARPRRHARLRRSRSSSRSSTTTAGRCPRATPGTKVLLTSLVTARSR